MYPKATRISFCKFIIAQLCKLYSTGLKRFTNMHQIAEFYMQNSPDLSPVATCHPFDAFGASFLMSLALGTMWALPPYISYFHHWSCVRYDLLWPDLRVNTGMMYVQDGPKTGTYSFFICFYLCGNVKLERFYHTRLSSSTRQWECLRFCPFFLYRFIKKIKNCI